MNDFEKVSSLNELRRYGNKQCVELQGRSISLFYALQHGERQVFAIDSRCYHTGGPLWEGAIEDIGSKAYVICPWHRYIIRLEDGISVLKGPSLKEKGLRQRTHAVQVTKNGDILVKLSKLPGGDEEIPSDHYCPATDEEKRRMGLLK